jgi:transcriptional regulator of acetoin/glycerol metabolism
LVEVKLQLEELRRRVDEVRAERDQWAAMAAGLGGGAGMVGGGGAVPAGLAIGSLGAGIEPPGSTPASSLNITPGMTMAEIERAAIVAALRESRGNRRKAAEVLDIGERTLYRKLKEYQVPEQFDG